MRVIYIPTITEEHYNIEDLTSEQLELIREAMEAHQAVLEMNGRSMGVAEERSTVTRKVHMLQNLLNKTAPPTEIVSFQPQDLSDLRKILEAVANDYTPCMSSHRLNELNEQIKEL